jgi:hypothetical protein
MALTQVSAHAAIRALRGVTTAADLGELICRCQCIRSWWHGEVRLAGGEAATGAGDVPTVVGRIWI